MSKKKKRWDWSVWLKALNEADLSPAAKSLGQEIAPVMKRSRKALTPWELPSNPGYGEFSPLIFAGLLYLVPGAGCFVPALDLLPAPDTIKTTPAMRRIIRRLLAGGDLYFTDRNSLYSRPGWQMRRDWNGPKVKIDQRSASLLLKLGLLEWDGCGNWPVFDHRRYRPRMRRLHGVKGFRSASVRWISEGLEQVPRESSRSKALGEQGESSK